MMEEEKKILESVQSQIASFDNKASILLSVVGIIFALTLSFLDVFHTELFVLKNVAFKFFYFFIFILYIITTIGLIISFILVIYPRTKKKDDNMLYPNYYKDIDNMSIDSLKESIKKYSKEETMLINQIKINANICNHKERCLKVGSILLFPFIFCIVAMIMMIMFA